jgi:hypothetical protein
MSPHSAAMSAQKAWCWPSDWLWFTARMPQSNGCFVAHEGALAGSSMQASQAALMGGSTSGPNDSHRRCASEALRQLDDGAGRSAQSGAGGRTELSRDESGRAVLPGLATSGERGA